VRASHVLGLSFAATGQRLRPLWIRATLTRGAVCTARREDIGHRLRRGVRRSLDHDHELGPHLRVRATEILPSVRLVAGYGPLRTPDRSATTVTEATERAERATPLMRFGIPSTTSSSNAVSLAGASRPRSFSTLDGLHTRRLTCLVSCRRRSWDSKSRTVEGRV
jgi:hypothetical protein